MMDRPVPQIARLICKKGARNSGSQLDHGPGWRCAKEIMGDPNTGTVLGQI
jgi:hypothetical protein